MAKRTATVAYENPRTDKKEAAYVGKVRRSLDAMGAPNSGELLHNSMAYVTGVYRAGVAPEMAASVLWHQHCEKAGSQTTPCVAEAPTEAACPPTPIKTGAACPPAPPLQAAFPTPLKVRGHELVITTLDGFTVKIPASHSKEQADLEAAFIMGRGSVQFGNCPVRVQSVEVKVTSDFIEARDSFGVSEVPVARIVRDEEVLEAARSEAPEPIEDDEDAYELLVTKMSGESQEIFVVLCLDLNRQLSAYVEVARGQRDRVNVDVTDVMRPVIVSNCHGFIVAHNHPSGQAEPSDKDRELTDRIRAAAVPYSSKFIDHVVVGRGEWYSFADEKLKKSS
jgi:DNA repair protein RadC